MGCGGETAPVIGPQSASTVCVLIWRFTSHVSRPQNPGALAEVRRATACRRLVVWRFHIRLAGAQSMPAIRLAWIASPGAPCVKKCGCHGVCVCAFHLMGHVPGRGGG